MAGRVRKGHGKPGKSWILASELKFKNKVRLSEMEKQFQNQCKITSSWMFFILRFTFAQRCSCSVHIYIFPLVIHWRECVIKIFSQNRRTLIYDERKSRQRNQRLPSSKTTQRTAISNDVPRQPSWNSCCFPITTKPNYEERLPWGKHAMPKHRCLYPECEYKTEDVKDDCTSYGPLEWHTCVNH